MTARTRDMTVADTFCDCSTPGAESLTRESIKLAKMQRADDAVRAAIIDAARALDALDAHRHAPSLTLERQALSALIKLLVAVKDDRAVRGNR